MFWILFSKFCSPCSPICETVFGNAFTGLFVYRRVQAEGEKGLIMALQIYKNLRPCFRNFKFYTKNQIALVSTTKKNKDTLVYPDDLFPKKSPPPPKTVKDFENPKVFEYFYMLHY